MAMFSSPPTAGSAAALVKSRRGRSDLQINRSRVKFKNHLPGYAKLNQNQF